VYQQMGVSMIKYLACLLAVASAGSASAATIDFDSVGNGTVVTNQFAPATFSSIAGSQILTTAQNFNTSLPNFICSGRGGAINCVDPVLVAFSTAVSNLKFTAVGDNNSGVNGLVKVFNGATLLGTQNILGDANPGTNFLVDLSGFGPLTGIEITTTDAAGLGYDDFIFDIGAAAVPEPTTWAMMLAGFGAIGGLLRRRKSAAIAQLA
jgi:PEP-CTERM motif